jgi:hypothetical protein
MPRSLAWPLLLFALLTCRLPSLAQPAGGDQSLYVYVAQQINAGDVPYRDAWEQKPPGVFFIYALLQWLWPWGSIVAAADMAAAACTALLLVGLGRRMFGGVAGEVAAALFLLLGDPAIQRSAGLYVRGQCEVFIALAVTGALTLAWRPSRRPWQAVLAGALVAVAFWLKYNAIVYAIPVALALLLSPGSGATRRRDLGAAAASAIAVVASGLIFFAATGALTDLWLGTIAYNVAYSTETYNGLWQALTYVVSMPVTQVYVDGLWFLGGLGAVILIAMYRRAAGGVALAWVAAAMVSIALNGARGLPQYFVQATPALALTASAGLIAGWHGRTRLLLAAALVLGFWRVGVEAQAAWLPRAFGLPQAAANAAFDGRYLTGAIGRDEYLERFSREGGGKLSPRAVERLAEYVRRSTPARSPIYVFGFASGGVYVQARRESASRFFWSRPIVLEFEGSRPGYGSRGLRADLDRTMPSIVALQKHDWGLAEAATKNSIDFFKNTPVLREFLEAHYVVDYEDNVFEVWRRKG